MGLSSVKEVPPLAGIWEDRNGSQNDSKKISGNGSDGASPRRVSFRLPSKEDFYEVPNFLDINFVFGVPDGKDSLAHHDQLLALHFELEVPARHVGCVTPVVADPKDVLFRNWDSDYQSCSKYKASFLLANRPPWAMASFQLASDFLMAKCILNIKFAFLLPLNSPTSLGSMRSSFPTVPQQSFKPRPRGALTPSQGWQPSAQKWSTTVPFAR